jgi:hypothetical protein
MPINKIIPINEIILNSFPVINNARSAPKPADGMVERIVIG